MTGPSRCVNRALEVVLARQATDRDNFVRVGRIAVDEFACGAVDPGSADMTLQPYGIVPGRHWGSNLVKVLRRRRE